MYFWIAWQRYMKYSQKVRIIPSKLFENFLLWGIFLRTRCQAAGILTQQKVKSPKKYKIKVYFKKKVLVCIVCSLHSLQSAQSTVCSLCFNMTASGGSNGIFLSLLQLNTSIMITLYPLGQKTSGKSFGFRNVVFRVFYNFHSLYTLEAKTPEQGGKC